MSKLELPSLQLSKAIKQEDDETEAVDHPAHYNQLGAVCSKCGHPIECIDVVRHMDFDEGNAVKYVWRAKHKNKSLGVKMRIQNLEKAVWYLQDKIKMLKAEINES